MYKGCVGGEWDALGGMLDALGTCANAAALHSEWELGNRWLLASYLVTESVFRCSPETLIFKNSTALPDHLENPTPKLQIALTNSPCGYPQTQSI